MPKHLLNQLTHILFLLLTTVVVHGQSDVRTSDVEMIKQLEKLAYEPERLTAAEAYLSTRPPGDSSLILASLIHEFAVLSGNGGKFSGAFKYVDEEIRLRQNPLTVKDSIHFARALNLRSTLLNDFGQTEQSKSMNAKAMNFIIPLVAQGKQDAYDQYSRILKSRVLTAVNELDYELANQLIIRIKTIPPAERSDDVNDFLPLYEAYVAAFLGNLHIPPPLTPPFRKVLTP